MTRSGTSKPPSAPGLPAYGVLTGGTSRAELEEAGAVAVYRDTAELLEHLLEWVPESGD